MTSNAMQRSGGHTVVEACAAAGTTAVFAVHGVQIDPIFQACADTGCVLVDVRHEATAGFAAEAYARVTGRPGVAAVCPGPGFTNVLTSVANARLDRTPVLYVVGGTPDVAQETNGLQVGLDHAALATPLCKWAYRVRTADQVGRIVAQALRVMSTPPFGPVLLDVPADLLAGPVPDSAVHRGPPPVAVTSAAVDGHDVERCLDRLATGTRPVLLVGHTPSAAGRAALARFVATTGVPTFTGYGAIGALDDGDRHHGGTLYQLSRLPLDHRPDVTLAVGVQLGFDTPGLRDGGASWATTLLHVDADPAEIGRFGPVALGVVGDPDRFLAAAAALAGRGSRRWAVPAEWVAAVRASLDRTRAELDAIPPRDGSRLHPFAAARAVSDAVASSGAVLVGDGAVCKHWLHDALRLPAGATYLTHGRFGCMGMGTGLSIGAATATGRPVVCVIGDGALGFSLGEFEAIVRHRLPITFVVMNNARWGASMGFQLRPGGPGRVVGTELSDADYHAVMAAFGGHGSRVDTVSDLREALTAAIAGGVAACINVSTGNTGVAPEIPLLSA